MNLPKTHYLKNLKQHSENYHIILKSACGIKFGTARYPFASQATENKEEVTCQRCLNKINKSRTKDDYGFNLN
jgi:hypothetical protein